MARGEEGEEETRRCDRAAETRRGDEGVSGKVGGGAGDGCMHRGVGTIFKIIIRLFI